MVDNRPYKTLLGIYLLEKLGKEPILNGLNGIKTKVISKGGLKGIPQCNIEIEKDTLEWLSS